MSICSRLFVSFDSCRSVIISIHPFGIKLLCVRVSSRLAPFHDDTTIDHVGAQEAYTTNWRRNRNHNFLIKLSFLGKNLIKRRAVTRALFEQARETQLQNDLYTYFSWPGRGFAVEIRFLMTHSPAIRSDSLRCSILRTQFKSVFTISSDRQLNLIAEALN